MSVVLHMERHMIMIKGAGVSNGVSNADIEGLHHCVKLLNEVRMSKQTSVSTVMRDVGRV